LAGIFVIVTTAPEITVRYSGNVEVCELAEILLDAELDSASGRNTQLPENEERAANAHVATA
jgi:hypothetical protein